MCRMLIGILTTTLCLAGCIGVRSEQKEVGNTQVMPPPAAAAPAPAAGRAAPPLATPSLVRDAAPPFTGTALLADNTFGTLGLSDFKGRYLLLLFYPMDFTFVCPTEIIAFDDKLDEFKQQNCDVVGISVDSQFTHLAWKNTPRDKGGLGPIRFPLIADVNKQISRSYGVLWNEEVALRGLFLIDRTGKVRHALVNDLPVGRCVDEALRTLDAVIFVDTHGDEVCPANWRRGQATVKTTVDGKTSIDGLKDYLSKQEPKEPK
jgi:peroxiredoxin 2/4